MKSIHEAIKPASVFANDLAPRRRRFDHIRILLAAQCESGGGPADRFASAGARLGTALSLSGRAADFGARDRAVDADFRALHNRRNIARRNDATHYNERPAPMSSFAKPLQLGRDLLELNANALRRMIEQDAESFRKLMEVNQSFFSRLPEARDLPSLVSLQREYGETVWNGAQRALRARGEVLRESADQAGELLRHALAPAAEAGDDAAAEPPAAS